MRSILGGVIAAVLLAGVAAAPAVAAPKPEPLTWSVQPATATGLDQRPNFTLAVKGGERVVDYVAVSNYSKKPLTLNLYATDAFNTEKGEFSLLPRATAPKDVGSWVELKQNKVTVPARSRTTVPFSIDVPQNASPGDHTGGIVASLTTTAAAADSGEVAIDQRAGTRVYVRVVGEVQASLAVDDVKVKYESSANPAASGTAVVSYTVRNTGNTRLGAQRSVKVSGVFGLGSTTVDAGAMPELLPGERAAYSQRVTGVRPLVRLTGEVSVTPVQAGEKTPSLPPVTGSATTWAVPWTLVVAIVLIALLVWFALRGRSRRKAAPVESSASETVGGLV